MSPLLRPAADEFAQYFAGYVNLVPDGDVLAMLRRQGADMTALLRDVPESMGDRAYSPGKWTLKESLLHLIDTERVFTYRLLRVARGDATPLPGFDQDAWVPNSGASARTMRSLLAEFATVRVATLALIESLDDAAGERRGVSSEKPVSARAIVYIIAGHDLHHYAFFRDKYLA